MYLLYKISLTVSLDKNELNLWYPNNRNIKKSGGKKEEKRNKNSLELVKNDLIGRWMATFIEGGASLPQAHWRRQRYIWERKS